MVRAERCWWTEIPSVFASLLCRRDDIIFVCSLSVSDLNMWCPISFPGRWPGKWGMVSGYRADSSSNKDWASLVRDVRPYSLRQSHCHGHVAGRGASRAAGWCPGTCRLSLLLSSPHLKWLTHLPWQAKCLQQWLALVLHLPFIRVRLLVWRDWSGFLFAY